MSKVDREDWERVKYRMDEEGFHYCFDGYSRWQEIKDAEFHELRKAYLNAANALEKYVDMKLEEDDEWYKDLTPVYWTDILGNKMYGRILGSPDYCEVMNGQPSMYYVCTPGGSAVKSGRHFVKEISEDSPEMSNLLHFEDLSRESGNMYGGPDVLETVKEKDTGW